MSVIDTLRQNDPATTNISIPLRNHEIYSNAELAQALEQNPFVTEITVNFEQAVLADWGSLLRVMATRESLVKVTLMDTFTPEARTTTALVRAVLQALQQNTSIRCLRLSSVSLPSDMSSFVGAANSITNLTIWNCDTESAADLASSLQRHTNLQTLTLGCLADVCTSSIMHCLRANSALKTIIFFRGSLLLF